MRDVSGRYMKTYVHGEDFDPALGWRNTPEHRRRMIDFPARDLVLEQVKSV